MHIIKRGARGMNIVRGARDKNRFVESLFHLNDSFSDENWIKAIKLSHPFVRPEHWPERNPLVRLLAWVLQDNHFHLLVQEIRDGGTAKFMQRLGGSMTAAHNAKYSETGSLFQGAYKSKTVDEDIYMRYLAFYIQVKNVLEQRPGGLQRAIAEFDRAWEWAVSFPYSSLGIYELESSPAATVTVDKTFLSEMFPNREAFKKEALEMLITHIQHHEEYASYMLESW
jgi:putative transposase